jgi:hypothetical protein
MNTVGRAEGGAGAGVYPEIENRNSSFYSVPEIAEGRD